MALSPTPPPDRSNSLIRRDGDVRIPPQEHSKGRREIPWTEFVDGRLRPAIERASSRYQDEFEAYWLKVSGKPGLSASKAEVRTRFLKARVLYDMLRTDGDWGYRYRLPEVQRLKHPPALLRQIVETAGNPDGAVRPILFEGDCDDVSFLYADLAIDLGLSGTTVEMVRDDHVNVVVPLAPGLSLVLDPTGITTDSSGNSWDLPIPSYVPERGEPEKYSKGLIRPLNTHYRKGRSPFVAERGGLTVGDMAASNLVARLEARVSRSLPIPKAWEPLVRGMRRSIDCYKRHLTAYASPRKEATETNASVDADSKQAEQAAIAEYFICIAPAESPLERFGIYLAYLDWARCGFIPPEEYGSFDPLACLALLGSPFVSSSSNLDWRYHHHDRDNSDRELRELRSRLRVLDSLDPARLSYPQSSLIGSWLPWISGESDSRRGLYTLLGALSHTVNLHDDSLEL